MLEKIKKVLRQTQDNVDPKVSIYLPTARMIPDSLQDSITFKNLIQESQTLMEDKYNRRIWESIIAKLESLQKNSSFWSHSKDGLAVFASEDTLEYFRVAHSFNKKLVIQECFYITPLLDLTIVDGDYLIDLGKDRLTIYEIEGTRAEVLVQDQIKTSFPDLFDDFDSNSGVNFGGYGGKSKTTFHGHRARPEEQEKDREKYFRYVDQQLGKLLPNNEAHVILSGTSDTISQFRHIAKGNFYFDQAIEKPFDALGHKQQEKAIEDILEPHFIELNEAEKKNYGFMKARNKVVLDFDRILALVEQGRVEKLIISKKYAAKAEVSMNNIVTSALLNNVDVYVTAGEQFKDQLAGILRF